MTYCLFLCWLQHCRPTMQASRRASMLRMLTRRRRVHMTARMR